MTRIVLTHAHLDHAGGAAEIAARTGAVVHVHTADAGAVRGGDHVPGHDRTRAGRLMRRTPAQHFPPVAVGAELRDGDRLPGGLQVLHTPGHTPGHICLLHAPSGVLATGDLLGNHLRRVALPLPFVCSDPEENRRQVARVAALEPAVLAFAHGPEVRGPGAAAAVRRFRDGG